MCYVIKKAKQNSWRKYGREILIKKSEDCPKRKQWASRIVTEHYFGHLLGRQNTATLLQTQFLVAEIISNIKKAIIHDQEYQRTLY